MELRRNQIYLVEKYGEQQEAEYVGQVHGGSGATIEPLDLQVFRSTTGGMLVVRLADVITTDEDE